MVNQNDISKTKVLTAKGVAKVLILAFGEELPGLLQNIVDELWYAKRELAEEQGLPNAAEWAGDIADAISEYGG